MVYSLTPPPRPLPLIIHPPYPLEYTPPPSPVVKISKEEKGEFIFQNARGGGGWRRGMARRGVEITLVVDKWEVVAVAISLW